MSIVWLLRLTLLIGFMLPIAAAAQLPLSKKQSDEPIEITADSLVVRQEQQLATFSGNVDAVQGEMVLRADILRVFYDQTEGSNSDNSIRRIEASGSVFLSSPEETAEGDEGVYDVIAGTVTLTGSVVLTSDDNVVRGDRLEMDLNTGESSVVAAVKSTEGGEPGQRVRALFVPKSDKKAN